MSERSLARLFIKEKGMTFWRCRQRLQLIIAIRELASGTRVQRVAENLGDDSPSAFITIFKKALGKPPGQYFADDRLQARCFPATTVKPCIFKRPVYRRRAKTGKSGAIMDRFATAQ